tara:strand:- start:40 stop:177 length:138 start_codon:yes stop_codon:yes gene_type:complete
MEPYQFSIIFLGILILTIGIYFITSTLKQGREALKEVAKINEKNF